MNRARQIYCSVCSKSVPAFKALPASLVREGIVEQIKAEHPEWTPQSVICHDCHNHFRSVYVQNALTQEKGELTQLEHDVLVSLKEHETISENLNQTFDNDFTYGERLADNVARFGGSWTFILFFASVLIIWITVNSIGALSKPFDVYPYILLNLVLSCLAAIQAPIIMMSQNRQEAKDRLRAENDYRVNLKAELEIRHLHAKLDLLLTHQWQRLLEIQQVQTDLLEELSGKK